MPWSVIGAVVTEDWGESTGFDFVHGLNDEPRPGAGAMFGRGPRLPTRYPKFGMAEIQQASKSADPTTEGARANGYLDWVRGCLHSAADLAGKLARKALPLSFVDPADRPWAVRRRNANWVKKRITRGVLAGPRPS